jgi:hypothetical protein
MTDNVNYFGSADASLIASDFSLAERESFTVTRDILWSSPVSDRQLLGQVERRLIEAWAANDPRIGYNRRPKLKKEQSLLPV